MQQELPFLFIGSSQEARSEGIVDVFATALGGVAHCVPWFKAPQFSAHGSATTFSALCEAANAYDYAVFIISPDDLTESRGRRSHVPRDNVIFELGLFISAIGPHRVQAFVQESNLIVKLPSDVNGVNMPRFCFSKADQTASQQSIIDATQGFVANIQREGFRKYDLLLIHQWGFSESSREFEIDVSAAKITRDRTRIGSWKMAVAARIYDPSRSMEEDNQVIWSALRCLPSVVNDNIPFRLHESRFPKAIQPGTRIDANLILVPENVDGSTFSTVGNAVRARCRVIEAVNFTTGTRQNTQAN